MNRALFLILFLAGPIATALPAENPVSRAAEFNFRNPARQSLPDWVLGLDQSGGHFINSPGSWVVEGANLPHTGRLVIELDRTRLTDDLALGLVYEDAPDASLALQLWDKNDRVLVPDLVSNLVARARSAQTDTFVLPLTRFPDACKIAICRVSGRAQVYGLVLYPVLAATANDPKTGAEVTRLFGESVTVEKIREILARGGERARAPAPAPDVPANSSAIAAGYEVREGSQYIDQPRNGARVQRTIPVSGRAPRIPEGHHLYMFLYMGRDFWPKGEELIPVDGAWQTVVRHGGHDSASFSLGLFEVNPEAHTRFQAWRAEAKRTGKYPPLRDMSGTVRHSRISVHVVPD